MKKKEKKIQSAALALPFLPLPEKRVQEMWRNGAAQCHQPHTGPGQASHRHSMLVGLSWNPPDS